MKSNVIIAALAIVILVAGGAAVYFSLQKNAAQNAEENKTTALPEKNPGENPPDPKPLDQPPTEENPTEKNPIEQQPTTPDEKPEPDKDPTPVDKLLNKIHRNQTSLYSLTAKIDMAGYNPTRNDIVKTNDEKMKVGDRYSGEYGHKPGNKFYVVLKGEAEETRIYAYMHTFWRVVKSDSETIASRWLLGSSTMYEIIMLLQGAQPDVLKRIFNIELLDTRDRKTCNTLKSLGYTEDQMPHKYPKHREILLLTYRDETTTHPYDRIELVIDYVKAKKKSGREDEVPVIRMAKLYIGRDSKSSDDNPIFDSESIFLFTDYDLNFTDAKALSDDKFRFVPEKEGADVKVDDHVLGQLYGKDEILGRMHQTREYVVGVKADMTSESINPIKDKPDTIKGTLFFMEPHFFKMNTGTMDLGSNGKKAWLYYPKDKKAMVIDLLKRAQSAEKKAMPTILELYRMLVSQRMYELADEFDVDFVRPQDGKLEKIDGCDVLHLVLTRKKNAKLPTGSVPKINSADRIELWVEAETFLTIRVKTVDRLDSGKTQTITLSNMQTDRKIDNEIFALPEFPEGTKIDNK